MIFPMSRRAPLVALSPEERVTLQSWAKARSQPQRLVQRAQVVLLAAEGIENQEIAARLRISRPTVQLWRQRFLALRTAERAAFGAASPSCPVGCRGHRKSGDRGALAHFATDRATVEAAIPGVAHGRARSVWCSEPKLSCWLPRASKIRRSRRACAFRDRPCNCGGSDSWRCARPSAQRLVQRAQVVLLAAEGIENQEIAARLRISRPTVQLWRQRFLALRTAGLEKDAPRPGRLPRIPRSRAAAIVEATLHKKPPNATHWSTRTMAKAHGVSEATVRRIWQRHNLKPHRLDTFKLSRDPKFIDKLVDIVGLYLNPPDKALVLCV